MTAEREDLLAQVKSLRQKAEEAGVVENDPWSLLDEVWKGPEADLVQIAVLGQETIAAVRQAYVEGRIEESLVLEVLDLVPSLLPLALKTLALG
jgi:hypothetical protein